MTDKNRDRLMPRSLFWPSLIACAVLVVSAVIGSYFGTHLLDPGRDAVSVRIYPGFAIAGLMLVLGSAATGWGVSAFRPELLRLSVIVTTGLSTIGIGMISGGIFPGRPDFDSRELLLGEPQQPGSMAFALPVLFAQGGDRISSVEKARLEDSLATFRECETASISVRGFASSAPFQGKSDVQSDNLNRDLANRRAGAVATAVSNMVGRQVKPIAWLDPADMKRTRRIRDISDAGERMMAEERLNRRAELVWSDSPCNNWPARLQTFADDSSSARQAQAVPITQ